ncbi:rhomboid family intramembrane serine protease [Candidatus Woesearchaeota archaeon]|nr:rhomboid family intramembrane serine protease [Nanoarchaeota archaeon]MCB9370335.1 rhomboid family intramembrane serine protease [Candidatus Woesearchaeota archaeon]USN44857.1 MAG: rhomboid family intramembrane serine protease [Candidatus Woesearchaeota archaeon]
MKHEIESDSKVFFQFLLKIIMYLLLLPFRLLVLLFFIITANGKKISDSFDILFGEPFKTINELKEWFFQAKVTAFTILFLIFVFLLQILFLGYAPTDLVTRPSDLLSSRIYTVLSSAFLHANLIHLVSNCLAFLIFGRIVEKHFGKKLFFLFVASAVLANLVSLSISLYLGQEYFSLGASGGICGIIMLAILLEPFSWTSIFLLPLPLFVVGWALIYLDLMGLTAPSTTNHLAHLAGYFSLVFLLFFFSKLEKEKVRTGFLINCFFLILAILLALFVF